jgi:hypothetical protein
MMTPVMNHYGLCVECAANTGLHMGVNAGFLTFLKFFLTEDFCVAAMTNKSGLLSTKMIGKLAEAGNRLFENKKIKTSCT